MEQEQQDTTLSKLDTFFCDNECDVTFSKHIVHGLSSSLSYYFPLLLEIDSGLKRPKTFWFENFRIKMSSFSKVIADAWDKEITNLETFQRPFHKLKTTCKKLRPWSKSLFFQSKSWASISLGGNPTFGCGPRK
jgi:hypothetical protein